MEDKAYWLSPLLSTIMKMETEGIIKFGNTDSTL